MQLLRLEDNPSCFFGNSVCVRAGLPPGQGGHHRGVDDSEPLRAMHPELEIHGARVGRRAHRERSRDGVGRVDRLSHVPVQLGVGEVLERAQGGDRVHALQAPARVCDFAAQGDFLGEAEALAEGGAVLGRGQEVGLDDRLIAWVPGPELDSARRGGAARDHLEGEEEDSDDAGSDGGAAEAGGEEEEEDEEEEKDEGNEETEDAEAAVAVAVGSAQQQALKCAKRARFFRDLRAHITWKVQPDAT
mmetsp:Transcript_10863/g.25441  ORF Transcript_10863/g.25441 Transcript_10863/m.25441 type:complete len:246 (-) Transcript_10863:1502-2239(-)